MYICIYTYICIYKIEYYVYIHVNPGKGGRLPEQRPAVQPEGVQRAGRATRTGINMVKSNAARIRFRCVSCGPANKRLSRNPSKNPKPYKPLALKSPYAQRKPKELQRYKPSNVQALDANSARAL